jgi:hypothetical protein
MPTKTKPIKPSARLRINERSLRQRINRKLGRDGKRPERGECEEQQVGRYFILDVQRNSIERKDVDLEELGREVGVLQAWEQLEKGQ